MTERKKYARLPGVSDPALLTAASRVLRRWQTESGLDQVQLAARVGCSQPTLSCLVRGLNTPSLHMIFALAQAFDCPPARLVSAIDREYELLQEKADA